MIEKMDDQCSGSNGPPCRKLADYQNSEYDPGRGFVTRTVWYFTSLLLFENGWTVFGGFKSAILRMFGATVGEGLVIHPNVRIKYPWRLDVGNDCWIGRDVWIDNLDDVRIESDVCISQGAYLCTGSHDHKSPTFELKTGSIVVEHGAWICCRATLLGNSRVSRMEVVPAGTVYSNRKAQSDKK